MDNAPGSIILKLEFTTRIFQNNSQLTDYFLNINSSESLTTNTLGSLMNLNVNI